MKQAVEVFKNQIAKIKKNYILNFLLLQFCKGIFFNFKILVAAIKYIKLRNTHVYFVNVQNRYF